MGKLFERIKRAVREDRFLVGWHADEALRRASRNRLADRQRLRECRVSKPHPSVVVRQMLPDGTEVEVIWSWLERDNKAKLVTVFFRD